VLCRLKVLALTEGLLCLSACHALQLRASVEQLQAELDSALRAHAQAEQARAQMKEQLEKGTP
jgi:hypothetical protein